MSKEENKAIHRRIIEEVINKHNLAIADKLIDTNWLFHGTGGMDFQGRAGFKQMHTMLNTAFPNHHIKIDDMVAEEDKVVTRFTVTGTHTGGDYMGFAPTGRKFTMTGIIINRFVDGKIVEEWEVVDLFTQLQQLGVIPPVGGGG